MHVAEGYVLRALQAGASGYVPKGSTPSELELAVYAVARGFFRSLAHLQQCRFLSS